MSDDVKDFLSIWAAILSTVLAVMQLLKTLRDKPRLKVGCGLISRSVREDDLLKGTRIINERGSSKEVLLAISVANHGKKPIQIISIIIEDSTGRIIQVRPDNLPTILAPSTSITVSIQKEWLDMIEPTLFGVIDALGRKHTITKAKLQEIVNQCKNLPTRKGKFQRKDGSEEIVYAFQSADAFSITKRYEDILLTASNDSAV